jgi:hypothetical protein
VPSDVPAAIDDSAGKKHRWQRGADSSVAATQVLHSLSGPR